MMECTVNTNSQTHGPLFFKAPHGRCQDKPDTRCLGAIAWMLQTLDRWLEPVIKPVRRRDPLSVLIAVAMCAYVLLFACCIAYESPGSDQPQDCSSALAAAAPISARRRKQARREQEIEDLPDVAASYSRYSSNMQSDNSIEQQQRKCHDSAATCGHVICPQLEFADRAVSGTKRERTDLNRMLDAASQRQFTTLYLYSLSRLARESVITLSMLKKLVHSYGIRVICVAESIDTDKKGWELIASIYAAIHEQYIKELGAGVFRGHEQNLLNEYSTGDWCFGFGSKDVPGTEASRRGRHAKPRKTYVINDDHAEWVLQIFYWFVDEDRTIGWIVRELNRLKAPKDHRSTTPEWHHQLVVNLLENEKYIGIWPWGENQNHRDPETGKVQQKRRPAEECEQYTREFPHLRIIDDPTFERAQQKLSENAEKWEKHRNDEGQIQGSSSECNGRAKPRLLAGLLKCAQCGRPFHSTGKKVYCPGGKRGTCEVVTSASLELVESKVLEAIGSVLEGEDDWFNLVYMELLAFHDDFQKRVPDAILAKQRELNDLDGRIDRLLDQVELGHAPSDLNRRLEQRRTERQDVAKELDDLKSEANSHRSLPSRDWLREQLASLSESLNSEAPVANSALKKLMPSGISMELNGEPRRRSTFFRGHCSIHINGVCETLGAGFCSEEDAGDAFPISIDFKDHDELNHQHEMALKMYNEGRPEFEIAEELGVSRSRVTAILKQGFEDRGEVKPDGRSRRATLERKHKKRPLYQKIADEVMEMFDAGALLGEIAKHIGIDRNTVTSAVKYWHEKHGLPAPDGRTRRKALDTKSSRS
ncbi:recombinase family protein [Rubinisphaera italica]|nr:recombinase family protein [Rubinisphaera italica]